MGVGFMICDFEMCKNKKESNVVKECLRCYLALCLHNTYGLQFVRYVQRCRSKH